MVTILFYTPIITSRINYIVHQLGTIIGCDFQLESDLITFQKSTNPKISYDKVIHLEGVSILQKSTILLENTIHKESFRKSELEQMDDLTLSFLALTRYEEYQNFTPDIHQRFSFNESVFFQTFPIDMPFVDVFAFQLKQSLIQLYPNIQFKSNIFEQQITFDIDLAWKYQHHSTWKYLKSSAKNIIQLNFQEINNRINVLLKLQKDPYDIFDQIGHFGPNTLFFILIGNPSNRDFNLTSTNSAFRKNIKEWAEKITIGLHPSYYSNNSLDKLLDEKHRLENILEKPITKSRQHYIRLNFPHTYRNLIQIGIKEDYSMGFPEQIGFRAGTSYPFKWFDLEKNEMTNLMIHPFCIMDIILKKYLNLSNPEFQLEYNRLKQIVQTYHGKFIPCLHNHYWKEIQLNITQ